MTEDETVGWHHQLDGLEFEQAPGVGDGQGGLACCSSWCCKELDMTQRLNQTKLLDSSVWALGAAWRRGRQHSGPCFLPEALETKASSSILSNSIRAPRVIPGGVQERDIRILHFAL